MPLHKPVGQILAMVNFRIRRSRLNTSFTPQSNGDGATYKMSSWWGQAKEEKEQHCPFYSPASSNSSIIITNATGRDDIETAREQSSIFSNRHHPYNKQRVSSHDRKYGIAASKTGLILLFFIFIATFLGFGYYSLLPRFLDLNIDSTPKMDTKGEDNAASKLVIFRTYHDSSWQKKPLYLDAMRVTQQNIPGAKQIVFTDADIDKWMAEYFPPGTPEHAAYYSIHPQWGKLLFYNTYEFSE